MPPAITATNKLRVQTPTPSVTAAAKKRGRSNTPPVALGRNTKGATMPGNTDTTVYRKCRLSHSGKSLLQINPRNENRSNQLPRASPAMIIQSVVEE